MRSRTSGGLDAMVLFPTVAVCVEHCKENPARTYANVEAFNRWLEDDWGFGADGRGAINASVQAS